MMRKRQRIAEYLIEHASSLPYDCATELDLQVIPDTALVAPPPVVSEHPRNSSAVESRRELHFVQATWDPAEHAFTHDELEVRLDLPASGRWT